MAKSSVESEKFRKLGNEFFAKKQLDSALEVYNKAVLYAPYSHASYGYACGNRSALFLEKEAYKECLRDVERALVCPACPKDLKEKLMRRKLKCESELIAKNLAGTSLNIETNIIPELYGGINPNIPNVSGKVMMEYNDQCGRRLVAIEDIEPGSVLIVENPYASILLEHTRLTHCLGCHEILPLDFVPCHDCIEVRFCNEGCLEKHGPVHALECGQVDRLIQIGLAYLAYKIFTVAVSTKDFAERFCCKHQEPKEKEGTYGLHSGEIYDSGFSCVLNLMAHHELAKEEDKRMFKVVAQGLVQLAVSRKQWPTLLNELYLTSPNLCVNCKTAADSIKQKMAMDYLTTIFTRLIEMLICNAHAISALVQSQGVKLGDVVVVDQMDEWKIASAIYPTASLMNHSCKPNIFSSFTGRTQIVRAARSIKAGEEVLNCYGPQFGRMFTQERKEALKQQYYFDCHCACCSEPAYAKREAYFTALACPKCKTNCKTDCGGLCSMFSHQKKENAYASAIFVNSDGTEYVCEACNFRVAVEQKLGEISDMEAALDGILEKDPGELRDKLVPEALKHVGQLSDQLYYINNKRSSEWRDKTAGWLVRSGAVSEAAMTVVNNLSSVAFIYGVDSIELANEILKLFGIVSFVATSGEEIMLCFLIGSKNHQGPTQERLAILFKMAKKIFETHYGPNSYQLKELKELCASIKSEGRQLIRDSD